MKKDSRGPRERVYDSELSKLLWKMDEIARANGVPILVCMELDGGSSVNMTSGSFSNPSLVEASKAAQGTRTDVGGFVRVKD